MISHPKQGFHFARELKSPACKCKGNFLLKPIACRYSVILLVVRSLYRVENELRFEKEIFGQCERRNPQGSAQDRFRGPSKNREEFDMLREK